MTTPHKWAEVLHAIADGKPVQIRGFYAGKWNEWKNLDYQHVTPLSKGVREDTVEWRIKPEKKTGWVNVYLPNKNYVNSEQFSVAHQTKEAADKVPENQNRIACIQITYEEGEGL